MSHLDGQFSHGICPESYETIIKPDLERAIKTPPGLHSSDKDKKT